MAFTFTWPLHSCGLYIHMAFTFIWPLHSSYDKYVYIEVVIRQNLFCFDHRRGILWQWNGSYRYDMCLIATHVAYNYQGMFYAFDLLFYNVRKVTSHIVF